MKEKIILVGIAVAVVVFLLSVDVSDSMLGKVFEQFSKPDWSQIKERNIVKNSIPISVIEKTEQQCIASADNLELIINHQYFVRSQEFTNQLQYDEQNKTIVIPCDEFTDEKLELHVWYATEEAEKYPTKYEYFVTPLDDLK